MYYYKTNVDPLTDNLSDVTTTTTTAITGTVYDGSDKYFLNA